MLKRILVVLVAIVAIVTVVGFLLPGSYRVERSVVIAAEPANVQATVERFKTWQDWSAWRPEVDPSAKWEFEGPEAGVGSVMRWNGETLGRGEMKITQSDSADGVRYDLAFDEGAWVTTGGFDFAAEEGATRVTWFMEGDLGGSPISRYFGLVMDSFVGPDFETGLAGLKGQVEGGAEAPPSGEQASDG